MKKHLTALGVSGLTLFLACSNGADPAPLPSQSVATEANPADFVSPDDIKGDSAVFLANNLVSDALFMDVGYMTLGEVQLFLEVSPYGTRSFLADYKVNGKLTSQIVMETAQEFGLNPLVLLAKLQKEAGLVSKTVAPSKKLINEAMGCGCPDGSACAAGFSGFEAQVRCAGRLFQEYLADLENGGSTIAGWRVGKAKKTLDPVTVTPQNRATAALYTYTPWVAVGTGGNWLFWNVWKKYTRFVGSTRPNYHWMGGVCADDSQCPFDGGQCLNFGSASLCSRTCDKYCPDSVDAFTAATFCADLGSALYGQAAGYCLPKCDATLYQTNGGCPDGTTCVKVGRFGAPATKAQVCWPAG